MALTISYERFLAEADKFLQCSDRLRDKWEQRSLVVNPLTKERVQFLAKKCTIAVPKNRDHQSSEEDIQALVGIESLDSDNEDDHACIGSSVQTLLQPAACVATTELGEARTPVLAMCEYHVIYSLSYRVPVLYFTASYSNGRLVPLSELWKLLPTEQVCSYDGKRDILTQTEHPLLQRPFYCLHPCNTAKAMGAILGCLPSHSSTQMPEAKWANSSSSASHLFATGSSSVQTLSSDGHVCALSPSDCDANSCPFAACGTTGKAIGESTVPFAVGANYLVTWLSMFGPVAGLKVSADYSKSL